MTEPPWPERHARFYASSLGARVLELEVGLLLEQLPSRGTVLSVGCGLGLHEAEVQRARPGLLVVALDNDPGMLDRAPDGLRCVLGAAEALPISSSSLDAIFYVTSLDFAKDVGRSLGEAARTLRPGGLVVVHALNPASEWGRDTLKGRRTPWEDGADLGRLLQRELGGEAEVRYALHIQDEQVTLRAGPEEGAIITVRASSTDTL